MKLDLFTNNAAGKLVQTIKGQTAFVPNPLPPTIDKSRLIDTMLTASNATGELAGAARRLINPKILIRPLQRNEALLSSAMEGTHTTSDKLLLAEISGVAKDDDETREVRNYIAALETAQEMLKTLPISHRVIKAAHKVLLSGLSGARGSGKRPGEYRDEQNFIGSPTRRIEDARFVPPPPAEMQTGMDALEVYLNRDTTSASEALIDLAIAHYQLETIHPFADGNGRLGRMLVTLMSMSSGLFDQPLLYVSPAIEQDKEQYVDLMFNVSTRNEWHEWIEWFLEKVTISCRTSIATIDRLLLLQEQMEERARQNIRSANAVRLTQLLFETPIINVTRAAEQLSISYPAAKGLLDKFVQIGFVKELEDHYPRTFIAWDIVEITEPR